MTLLRGGEPLNFRAAHRRRRRRRGSSSRASSRCSSCTGMPRSSFEQLEPLGELTLRWTAERWSDENLANLGADYDR